MPALTAETLDSIRGEAVAAGMTDSLSKPIEPATLVSEAHLSSGRSADG